LLSFEFFAEKKYGATALIVVCFLGYGGKPGRSCPLQAAYYSAHFALGGR